MECSEANVKKVRKSLMNKIKKEESIMECATVKLSICSPQTGKIFRSFDKEGILCVIIDRNKSCLYLKQYDLIEFKLIFSIELYTNIADGYTVNDNHFHVIEFPGFFLGLSFPMLDNPNIANRSSLIQKAIISTSKFISIKLSEYIYLYEFDNKREVMKKPSRLREVAKRLSSAKIFKNPKSNITGRISISKENNELNNNNIDIDSVKKINTMAEIESNKNILEGKSGEIKEINTNNNIEENKSIINEESQKQLENPDKKPETPEEKEKKFFDSIPIEDSQDKKVYKIVQFHLIREEMKVVKKLYIKNFKEFIDGNKISIDSIKNYKINKFESLNDLFYSSDEGEEQKSIVDYIQGRDIIGDFEDEHVVEEDDRMKELRQKKNNLKEIYEKKNVNEDTAMKTNPV
jgi:hypothetical protein